LVFGAFRSALQEALSIRRRCGRRRFQKAWSGSF
jgi:hypothetical protein